MGLSEFFKNLYSRKVVHVPLTEDSLNSSRINQTLIYENAEQKGRIAKLERELKKIQSSQERTEEEENVKAELIKERDELKKKSEGSYFSMRRFIHNAFYSKKKEHKKYKNGIYFTSFDRKHKFSKFFDMGWDSRGNFVLIQEDEDHSPIMTSPKLTDIFQSCGSLGNDIEACTIPLNLDKEGDFVENIINYWELPLIRKDKNGEFNYSKAKKKPFYEYLKDNTKKMENLKSDLADAEEGNSLLQNEIDDLKRANILLQSQSDVAQKGLTKNTEELSNTNRVFANLTRELAKLRDVNILAEEKIDAIEQEISELRKKAIRAGIELSDEKAMNLIRQLRTEITNTELLLSSEEEKLKHPLNIQSNINKEVK